MILSLLSALTLSAAPMAEPALPCRFAGAVRSWTAQALGAWDRLDRERLRIAQPVTPIITLFDARCAYTLTPSWRGDFRVGLRRYSVRATAHAGQVALPDGASVPASRLAFASPTSDGGMFFIMALPSLWQANGAEPRDWRLLSMVVFMHEFAHTQQGLGLGRRVDDLLTRGLPENADDDIVQDQFGARTGYQSAYEAERDLFYGVASARNDEAARTDLAQAARVMAERRARWFSGPDTVYAEADDVFLTLEGTGNWAAWNWLTDPRGGRLSPTDATTFVRGGQTQWSQDQGLGIMLALDRVTPDWPAIAFAPRGVTADELIARALES
ncbi:MAG: hypothetical protein DCF29_08750 [Alphaproteobacteria bacterium]|nr:MAG: hypothetical protein DCF29_08750 [Alphaproteobacteria bacterium]